MAGREWTEEQDIKLKELYPYSPTEELVAIFDRTISAIYGRADILGLKKDAEYKRRILASLASKLKENGKAYQFKKGCSPPNKGRRQSEFMSKEAIERTKATRFKKGQKVWNHKPVGYERITKDGYVEVKFCEPNKFKLKHRLIWEQHNGEIPKGNNIQFRDGNKLNCNIENLYIIDRKKQMIGNSGTLNLPDGMIASYLAGSRSKRDRALMKELVNHPELLELKRKQLLLNRKIKSYGGR